MLVLPFDSNCWLSTITFQSAATHIMPPLLSHTLCSSSYTQLPLKGKGLRVIFSPRNPPHNPTLETDTQTPHMDISLLPSVSTHLLQMVYLVHSLRFCTFSILFTFTAALPRAAMDLLKCSNTAAASALSPSVLCKACCARPVSLMACTSRGSY